MNKEFQRIKSGNTEPVTNYEYNLNQNKSRDLFRPLWYLNAQTMMVSAGHHGEEAENLLFEKNLRENSP